MIAYQQLLVASVDCFCNGIHHDKPMTVKVGRAEQPLMTSSGRGKRAGEACLQSDLCGPQTGLEFWKPLSRLYVSVRKARHTIDRP